MLLNGSSLCAAEDGPKNQGPPPMLVEIAAVTEGSAEPMVELVGSVQYARMSRVAAEVSGIVEQIAIIEGGRVKAGQPLVVLRSDLLKTALASTQANYDRARIELEKVRKDLKRVTALYEKKSVAESLYDENYYRVLALEKQAEALKAALARQQLELEKTTIVSPFTGLIQRKLTEQGEWVSTGGQIAVVVDDRHLEAHIDVPQKILGFLHEDKQLSVTCGGKKYNASFIHFIPRGDIATRTFTVKLKIHQAQGLIAGMEAKAQLPSGPEVVGLRVPRDAVINKFGKNVVFLATNGIAKMLPVVIRGYQGMDVSVEHQELTPGAMVVVKGNERIQDGQPIRF